MNRIITGTYCPIDNKYKPLNILSLKTTEKFSTHYLNKELATTKA